MATLQRGGTYVLILGLRRRVVLKIGRMGAIAFHAGNYAYVGSAHGPGGLAARLKHHLGPSPRPHWHIDYLKAQAPIVEIWAAAHRGRQECRWARALACVAGTALPAPGFGASDCRCGSHLFYFPEPPRLRDFNHRLAEIAGGGPAFRISPIPQTERGGIDVFIDAAP